MTANRFRAVREAEGLTLKELGARAGVSFGTPSKMERGDHQANLLRLRRTAAGLECNPVELHPEDMGPAELVEIAALYARLSPEDRAVLKRVSEGLGGLASVAE